MISLTSFNTLNSPFLRFISIITGRLSSIFEYFTNPTKTSVSNSSSIKMAFAASSIASPSHVHLSGGFELLKLIG